VINYEINIDKKKLSAVKQLVHLQPYSDTMLLLSLLTIGLGIVCYVQLYIVL